MIFNIDTHIGTYWTDPKAIRYINSIEMHLAL